MHGYIYKRVNKVNNKVYIGQHRYHLPELDPRYQGSGVLLQKAFKRYGIEAFTIELIALAESQEELDLLEEKHIAEYNSLAPNGYNLRTGGNNNPPGLESRKNMSEAQKKYHMEHPEVAIKRSIERQGEGNPMFGKTQSDYQKQKVKELNTGKSVSDETRQKMREARLGKPAWNKGIKGERNSSYGSYWITDGTWEGNQKWRDDYGPIPEGKYKGRFLPKRKEDGSYKL